MLQRTPPLPAFHGVVLGEGVGATALKHLFAEDYG
jgi:hypothetical protein